MKFINKLKYNYYLSQFKDLFKDKNYSEIHKILNKIENDNQQVYYDLLFYLNSKYLMDINHDNFFDKKIIWLNSFNIEATEIFQKFFNYYFLKLNFNNFNFSHYNLELSQTFKKLKISNPNYLEDSCFYQSAIMLNSTKKYNFMISNSSFFEYKKEHLFICPTSTLSYLYIKTDPFHLYAILRDKLQSKQEAMNYICNLDQTTVPEDNFSKEGVFKMDWKTNMISWSDDNVISTYRGKIIDHSRIKSDTKEVLIETIHHLINLKLPINLDYSIIDSFITENHNLFEIKPIEISNKERKLIERNLKL